MSTISRESRLSTLVASLRRDRDAVGLINPRLVRSIQQSLAVEGYDVPEDEVRRVGEQVTR